MAGLAGSVPVVSAFADRLVEAVERKRTQLVVGLDPVPSGCREDRSEVELDCAGAAAAFARFCRGIVDAVAPFAVAVKPQSAFFEALGPAGVAAYTEVCDHARAAGLIVIADAKRGDIGSTARAYAAAFVEPRDDGPPLADSVTVNPYMGRDLRRAVPRRLRRNGRRPLLPRQDVEPRRRRDPGSRPLRRAAALAAGRRARRRVGRRARRRTRALGRRRGRRRDVSARGRRGTAAAPEGGLPVPGVGAPGGRPADLGRFAARRVGARRRPALGHHASEQAGGDWRAAAAARPRRRPARSGPSPAGRWASRAATSLDIGARRRSCSG